MKWLLSWAAVAALAPPLSAAVVAPCATDTLDGYLGLSEGCSVGSVVFSDFSTFSVPGAFADVSPSSVTVTPTGGPFDPGFAFGGPFTAAANEFIGLGVEYRASGAIVGNQAALESPAVTGDGAITLFEDKCFEQDFTGGICLGAGDFIGLFATADDGELMGSLSFPKVSSLAIRNEIGIDGGLSGSASLGAISNSLSAVPEPTTVVLTGCGLVALVALRRRGRSAANEPSA